MLLYYNQKKNLRLEIIKSIRSKLSLMVKCMVKKQTIQYQASIILFCGKAI